PQAPPAIGEQMNEPSQIGGQRLNGTEFTFNRSVCDRAKIVAAVVIRRRGNLHLPSRSSYALNGIRELAVCTDCIGITDTQQSARGRHGKGYGGQGLRRDQQTWAQSRSVRASKARKSSTLYCGASRSSSKKFRC